MIDTIIVNTDRRSILYLLTNMTLAFYSDSHHACTTPTALNDNVVCTPLRSMCPLGLAYSLLEPPSVGQHEVNDVLGEEANLIMKSPSDEIAQLPHRTHTQQLERLLWNCVRVLGAYRFTR